MNEKPEYFTIKIPRIFCRASGENNGVDSGLSMPIMTWDQPFGDSLRYLRWKEQIGERHG